MTWQPRKDLAYAAAIWSAPVVVLLVMLLSFSWTLLAILALSAMLSWWLWSSTGYEIEDGELRVRCWVLRRRVPVGEIRRVRRTRNVKASCALAVERLEITLRDGSTFFVSPADEGGFVAELKRTNPGIAVG